jgi:hypothetical protein
MAVARASQIVLWTRRAVMSLVLFSPLHDQRPTQTDAVAVCSLVFLQHLAIEKGGKQIGQAQNQRRRKQNHQCSGAERLGRSLGTVATPPPPALRVTSLLSLPLFASSRSRKQITRKRRAGPSARHAAGGVADAPARRRASDGAPGSGQKAVLRAVPKPKQYGQGRR